MKLKTLVSATFEVVGIAAPSGDCEAEDFLLAGPANEEASRLGLLQMLEVVAELGLQDVPSKWWHEANKREQIYEFIKGPLRLFFFKGQGKQIAVCTGGGRKRGGSADPKLVASAAEARRAYFEAAKANKLEVIDDDEDQQGAASACE